MKSYSDDWFYLIESSKSSSKQRQGLKEISGRCRGHWANVGWGCATVPPTLSGPLSPSPWMHFLSLSLSLSQKKEAKRGRETQYICPQDSTDTLDGFSGRILSRQASPPKILRKKKKNEHRATALSLSLSRASLPHLKFMPWKSRAFKLSSRMCFLRSPWANSCRP